MKKISLKNLNLKEVEELSRTQLKDVLGGWTGGTGSDEVGGTDDPNPKITACQGMNEGDTCDWSYQGNYYTGRCLKIPPGYILHCSDLA